MVVINHKLCVFHKMSDNAQAKRWCFTKHLGDANYEAKKEEFIDLVQKCPRVLYSVMQLERAPTTGAIHFQGYLALHDRLRLSQLRALFPGCHWTQAKGSTKQNRTYCTKEESRIDGPWEHGDADSNDGQGHRTDISEACKFLIEEKKTLHDLAMTHSAIFVKYHGGFKALDQQANGLALQRDRVEVNVFYGRAGCGKTHWALSQSPKETTFILDDLTGKWWDGLTAQTTHLILDEFEGQMPFTLLKRVLDKYPIRVPVKGSTLPLNVTTIWITSNLSPEEWYPDQMQTEVLKDSLFRRFTNIFRLTRSEQTLPAGFVEWTPASEIASGQSVD